MASSCRCPSCFNSCSQASPARRAGRELMASSSCSLSFGSNIGQKCFQFLAAHVVEAADAYLLLVDHVAVELGDQLQRLVSDGAVVAVLAGRGASDQRSNGRGN